MKTSFPLHTTIPPLRNLAFLFLLLFSAGCYESLKKDITGDWKFEKVLQNQRDLTRNYQHYSLAFKEETFHFAKLSSPPEEPNFPSSGKYNFTNMGKSLSLTWIEKHGPGLFTNGGESEESLLFNIKEHSSSTFELAQPHGDFYIKLTR